MIYRKPLFIATLAVSMIALKGCIFKNSKQAPTSSAHVFREHVEDDHSLDPKVEQKLVSQVTAELVPSPGAKSGFSVGAGMARDNNRIYDNAIGQIFLAKRAGRLRTIEAVVSPGRVENPAPLVVTVLKLKNGIPDKIIATSSVRYEDFNPEHVSMTSRPPNYAYTIKTSFAKDAPILKAGTHYALRFSSSESPANYRITGCNDPPDPYLDGVRFKSKNSPEHWLSSGASGDLYFRVVVMGAEQADESIVTRPPFVVSGEITLKKDTTSVHLKRVVTEAVATHYQADYFQMSVPSGIERPFKGHHADISHEILIKIWSLKGADFKKYVIKQENYRKDPELKSELIFKNDEALVTAARAFETTKEPRPWSGKVYTKECVFYKQYADTVLIIAYKSNNILMELSQEKRDIAINYIRKTLDSLKINGKPLDKTNEIMDPVGKR